MEELEKLLELGEWEKANTQTHRIIRDKFSQINSVFLGSSNTLYSEGFKNFPGEDINALDELWIKYSNKRFGISIQKNIYKNVGGRLDGRPQQPDDKDIEVVWKDFSSKVGWKDLANPNITFNNVDNAPDGHLPCWNEEMIKTSGFVGLFGRIENCKLSSL
ncbi:GUN4 domain-containing protein [Nodularia chucula]|uniref:GUN4 domain-containing protein n=1 Tax=Nodularia chucula TaxID=3093667 RepID=UPI0039C744B0